MKFPKAGHFVPAEVLEIPAKAPDFPETRSPTTDSYHALTVCSAQIELAAYDEAPAGAGAFPKPYSLLLGESPGEKSDHEDEVSVLTDMRHFDAVCGSFYLFCERRSQFPRGNFYEILNGFGISEILAGPTHLASVAAVDFGLVASAVEGAQPGCVAFDGAGAADALEVAFGVVQAHRRAAFADLDFAYGVVSTHRRCGAVCFEVHGRIATGTPTLTKGLHQARTWLNSSP